MMIIQSSFFGGFNKDSGTLAMIEKFEIKEKKISPITLSMSTALRRFSSIKISSTKILLIGGLERMNKESDAVYWFDLDLEYGIEKIDKIERAGVVDFPIIVDTVGNLHLLINILLDNHNLIKSKVIQFIYLSIW